MTETAPTLLVGGTWRGAAESHPVHNPASQEEVGRIAKATTRDTRDALDAGAAAFSAWSATPPRERGDVLRRGADLLDQRADEIAWLLCAETGKLLTEARGEIQLSAEFLRWFAEEGRRARGEVVPVGRPAKRASVIAQPVGLVAVLTPWNFPVSIQARKLAPALAAGCTVVSRPSEVAPLAVIELIRCLQEAGLPAGTLNLLTGPVAQTSDVMLADPRVRAVSFTGSTRVGGLIATAAAKTMARTALELGGDAPFIVFDDADLDLALEQAVIAKYRNNGQSCIAMNRLLLHEPIAAGFLDAFAARSRELVVGDPADETTTLGPVISVEARERLYEWADEARRKGGRVVLGDEADLPSSGSFAAPVIIADPPEGSSVACKEVFGPLVGAWTFSDEKAALERANASDYGLAAYVCTQDLGRAARVAEGLHAGIVGVNDAGPTTPEAPFGGVGLSGHGKEGGHQGLSEFLNYKFVSTRLSR